MIKNSYTQIWLIALCSIAFSIVFSTSLKAQSGTIRGSVLIDDAPTEFVTIEIDGLGLGTTTNRKGEFFLQDIPLGNHTIIASYVGYQSMRKAFSFTTDNHDFKVAFKLTEQNLDLDEIVVTGTKTFKRLTNSPVIVNVLSSQALDNVQACNLSDGLKFQPGLRVETNCQTCNYTQLRMNGLAGGYSQILINGRPIFSPLTGLYGLEQLPVNMIERIEILRGGGSSLYGSSAVGGTVNVITKIPKKNSYELNSLFQNINGQSSDIMFTGNTTLVASEGNAGLSIFINNRKRDFYDHNADNFSEIPLLENTALGANLFFLPTDNQKLEFSLSNLNEYRFGGEMDLTKPAYLTEQSEERTTRVWMGSLDYQINFNQDKTSLITYMGWQKTDRSHYTGILPDKAAAYQSHIENPPYGISDVSTFNTGIQLNHKFQRFIKGRNVFTFGSEYIYDQVYDEIPAYDYLIDQTTKNIGMFLQSDWQFSPSLTLLSGVRMDLHNFVDQPIVSPRLTLLYKPKENIQFRANYGTGFRAPQAFDADLHIAFAGGGISRIALSQDLKPETSNSISASMNYDKATEHFVAGFTLEGFHTRLNQAYFLQPVGADEFGELFEKQNGQGATVQGGTLELRANFNRKMQIETGFTLQTSLFDNEVEYIDGIPGIKQFTRTPNDYGFATISLTPNDRFSANFNYVYTGSMKIPHFAGAPNQEVDEIIDSKSFSELSLKLAYALPLKKFGTIFEFFGGIKNVLNDYQSQFDIGKNRDSNFVYGPGQPRTYYLGLKLRSGK